MSELTREQVEQLPGRLTEIHFNSMWALALATDAALRARILELEQALRLHLAVSPDDPLLIEPVEQEVVRLQQQLVASQDQLEVAGLKAELLQEEVAELKQQLAASQELVNELEAQVDDLPKHSVAYKQQIDTLTTRIEQLDAQRVVMEAENERLAQLQAKNEGRVKEIVNEQLLRQVDTLTTRLAQAQRETWEQAADMVESDCFGDVSIDFEGITPEQYIHNLNQITLAKKIRQQAAQGVGDE